MERRDLLARLLGSAALLGLGACAPREPLRLGFLGGLSGKFADLGSEERNAALLAIEAFNRDHPLPGGAVELLEQDDAQDPARAAQGLRALAQAGVVAVIGPATSSIGVAVAPLAAELGLLLVSPTCTTARLSGRDDALVRVCGDTAVYGASAARAHTQYLKPARFSTLADLANADYTRSWVQAYQQGAAAGGAKALQAVEFTSTQPSDHEALAAQLLQGEPDLVALCCSSVDAALVMQKLRARRPGLLIAASAWSSTSRTIELAGRAADGSYFEQYYNPADTSPAYLQTRAAFEARFRQPLGFAGVLASDATRIVLQALAKGATRATLKSQLLNRRHAGLQGELLLDAFGDTQRPGVHLVVRDGRFEATGWAA